MGNHFHLLLFSEQGRLSDGMRMLTSRFTQRVNYRDRRDGPLCRGRFASISVDDDAHLVRVSRYIHRNPVEAGLVRKPQAWPWSSAAAYLGLSPKPDWLNTSVILDMFGIGTAQRAYRAFLEAELDEITRASYERWNLET